MWSVVRQRCVVGGAAVCVATTGMTPMSGRGSGSPAVAGRSPAARSVWAGLATAAVDGTSAPAAMTAAAVERVVRRKGDSPEAGVCSGNQTKPVGVRRIGPHHPIGRRGRRGGELLQLLAWRAALRPPHEPLRGRASRAPVTLLRQNIMLLTPASSRARTTDPSGSVTFELAVT